jgi:hypothetical protein
VRISEVIDGASGRFGANIASLDGDASDVPWLFVAVIENL